MNRRRFLIATAGITPVLGYFIWDDSDNDGKRNYEEVQAGYGLRDFDADWRLGIVDPDHNGDGVTDGGELVGNPPGIVQQTFQYISDNFSDDAVDNYVTFIQDEQVDERYKVNFSKLYHDLIPDRYGEKKAQEWQKAIAEFGHPKPNKNGFYLNNPAQDGLPILLPNGKPGPGFKDPITPSTGGDALLEGYYASEARTHNIRTGETIPFDPEPRDTLNPGHGDRIGIKGHPETGNGSILQHFPHKKQNDFLGHRNIIFYENNIKGTRFSEEAEQIVKNWFTNLNVENPDGTTGIQTHIIQGNTLPYDEKTSRHEAIKHYRENVPKELWGPANYSLIVPETEASGAGGNTFFPVSGASGSIIASENQEYLANTLIHEFFHGAGWWDHKMGDNNIMASGWEIADSQLERILGGMDAANQEFYRSIIREPPIPFQER